jgi:flagellar hook-basal body complex protein FliE
MMIGSVNGVGFAQSLNTIGKPPAAQAAGAPDFGKVLADVAASTVDALKGAEAASIGGIKGTLPVQDVVQAVMTAEQALQTAIAVRDKLVAAYTEITRMQI